MFLSPSMHRYVLHWGEMGTRWGVNRSVAQIHALLYLAETPLNAEEIAETLGIARSNVSNSLKELLSWGLIRLTHMAGDRRDHFEARTDPWDMIELIADGRKRREIDPTLEVMRACLDEAEADAQTPAVARARIREMHAFMTQLDRWYGQMRQAPRPLLKRMISLGGKIFGLMGR
jgi:DNA-binding transcriptional regulator GbsR (MarR family)